MLLKDDLFYMQQALVCAKEALKKNEVPVGAVLVVDGKLLASACNHTVSYCDPTAHAEIIILREAAKIINNYRLLDATIYVSLEPCPMCVGAMIQARIKRLVFAAYDTRLGALGSLLNILDVKKINHKFSVVGGVLENESAQLLKNFFLSRRQKKKKNS